MLNSSVASNNLGLFKDTIENCSQVLEIDPKNVKAYFLRSQAHTKVHAFEEALGDLKEAIKLNPGDKKLREDFENVKKLRHD